ncbi:MAG: hypothetical protein AAFP19_13890, partial [Bacteroidota bacterium]
MLPIPQLCCLIFFSFLCWYPKGLGSSDKGIPAQQVATPPPPTSIASNNCESSFFQERVVVNNIQLTNASIISDGNSLFLSARASSYRFTLMKGNLEGQIEWIKTYDPEFFGARVTDLILTSNNELLIIGGSRDVAIAMKVNKNGDLIWVKRYDDLPFNEVYTVIEASNGDFLIGGTTTQTFGQLQGMLIRISPDGSLVWSRRLIHAIGTYTPVTVEEIVPALDGGYLLFGRTATVNYDKGDLLIIKVDENGQQQWIKRYDRAIQRGLQVLVNQNRDGYLISHPGEDLINSNSSLMEIDVNGLILRSLEFEYPDFFRISHFTLRPNGDILIGGSVTDVAGIDDGFLFLGLLDQDWNIKKLQSYSEDIGSLSANVNFGKSFIENNQRVYITGTYLFGTPYTSTALVKTDENLELACNAIAFDVNPVVKTTTEIPFDINMINDRASSRDYNMITGSLSHSNVTFCRTNQSGNPILTFEQQNLCDGDTLWYLGQAITESDTITSSHTAINGCDSIHQIEATFQSSFSLVDDLQLCVGDTAFVLGQFYTNDVVINSISTNANGCDSIIDLRINFDRPVLTFEERSICRGDSLWIDGQYISQATTIDQSLTTTNGCDSFHQIAVRVVSPQFSFEQQAYCEGETALIFGQSVSSNDTLSQTLVSSDGCDSTHQVIANFSPRAFTSEIIQACQGEVVQVFNQSITQDDWVQASFTASNGCDSIHQVEVQFLDQLASSEVLSLCEGQVVQIFGQSVFESDTLEQTFTASNGCDSTHQVIANFLTSAFTSELIQACQGEVVQVYNQSITQDDLVQVTFTASNGCDSIHQVEIQFLDQLATSQVLSLCEGQVVQIFGQDVFQNDTLIQVFIASNGCDSLHQVIANFSPSVITYEQIQACRGEIVQ